MGLKKYEIITVGSDKRVRALRSWAVGDRYVNIGDVGGIVYDEKTLSQDGLCWLFSGNFGFPGARIGGDSIVDVGEIVLSPAGTPNVDILGSSVVVGSKLRFESDQTEAGTYETKLSIIDSRVEINPATSTGMSILKPGGNYTIAPGAKYPESIIRNSKVVINGHATADRTVRLMSVFIGCNVVIDATLGSSQSAGVYSNVNNLTFTGAVTNNWNVAARSIIQATDCNDFAVSPTIFPAVSAAQTANTPFIFQGCNVPDGRFYHHAQIANTYKNVDFALAQADLGKTLDNVNITLVSSEVEGMYRLYSAGSAIFGALVESHETVKSVTPSNTANSYGTTIYKDAYLSGKFDIAGTNVFGNKVRSHPMAQVLNVQPRAVQGLFNTITVGGTITGVTANANRVCVPLPFRINGAKGITINCPTGVEGSIVCTDIDGVIKGLTALATGESSVPAARLVDTNAYLFFGKAGGGAITPADLVGVTMTVYNGCKIVNTGATAVNMKGNIRVEDNATLINSSINGTGYFGGNAVMSGMVVSGYAYMKDNTLCTKTSEDVQVFTSLVMEGNAVYNSKAPWPLARLNVFMYDNSKMLGVVRPPVKVVMRDNATITAAGFFSGSDAGSVTLKDNAILGGSLTILGDITLCGSYNQTVSKTWTGKRVIDNENAPEYDNNVKTQYDF